MFLVYHFSLEVFHFDPQKYAEAGILIPEVLFLFEPKIIVFFNGISQYMTWEAEEKSF